MGCANKGRRAFLVKIEQITKFLAFFVLLVPVMRFLGFTTPKKPEFVTVNKVLKKDGFILEPDFILFDTETEPLAVSRTCTHLGCKLNYHELERLLICPCHRSRFSRAGKRLAGPARLDLPTFKVAEIGTPEVTGYIVTIV